MPSVSQQSDEKVIERLVLDFRKKTCASPSPHQVEAGTGIVVCARKRPLSESERSKGLSDVVSCCNPKVFIHEPKRRVDNTRYVEHQEYALDHTFDADADTASIYKAVVGPMTKNVVLNGVTATCFAYGQTGSGKTYTMTGIEELAAKDIFAFLKSSKRRSVVRVGFFEISGQRVFDLLNNHTEVFVREDERGDVHVQGLGYSQALNADELLEIIRVGSEQRTTRQTQRNEASSRSHAVCQILLYDQTDDGHVSEAPKGRMCLVDLAGSERGADTTEHDKDRQQETIAINSSLMVLKECIRSRVLEMKAGGAAAIHVPYRQSRLTLLLKEAFTRDDVGTAVIVTLSPIEGDIPHSTNACRFADRIKEKGTGSSGMDKDDPRTWTKQEVYAWIWQLLATSKTKPTERLFTPMDGKALCLLTKEECIRHAGGDASGYRVYDAIQRKLKERRENRDKEAKENSKLSPASTPASAPADRSDRSSGRQIKSASPSAASAATPPPLPSLPAPLPPSSRPTSGIPAAPVGISPSPPTKSPDEDISPSERRRKSLAGAALSVKKVGAPNRVNLAPCAEHKLRLAPAAAGGVEVEKKVVAAKERKRTSLLMLKNQFKASEQPKDHADVIIVAGPRHANHNEDEPIKFSDCGLMGGIKQFAKGTEQRTPSPKAPSPDPNESNEDVEMEDTADEPIPHDALGDTPMSERDPEQSPEQQFEEFYGKLKEEVSDKVMDSHYWTSTTVNVELPRVQLNTPFEEAVSQYRDQIIAYSISKRSLTVAANKALCHTVESVIMLHNTFLKAMKGKTDQAEQQWLGLYDSLNTGYTWDTMSALIQVAALCYHYRRLLYLATPLQDLVPYVELLRMKVETSTTEATFWSTFGANNRKSHMFSLNGVNIEDHSK